MSRNGLSIFPTTAYETYGRVKPADINTKTPLLVLS
jgi:hypothetical protein